MKRHGMKVGDLVEWTGDGDIGIVVAMRRGSFGVKWSGETKIEWYRSAKRIGNLRRIS